MNIGVLYFSRTGNTRSMAQAISQSLEADIHDIALIDPSLVSKFDLLIVGTPVEGFKPAKEIGDFIEKMPKTEKKKAIVFCTYVLWKAGTLNSLASKLAKKGYKTILKISKKKVLPGQTDFSNNLDQIKKTIETF
jgi:flavodoxin